MGANRLGFVDALPEILTLQHLLQGDAAVQPDHVGEGHLLEPIAIEDDPGSLFIKHLESLLLVCPGIRQHFVMGQLRPRRGTSARIPDHRGEIADQQNAVMTEVLELPQFLKGHRVAEVDVGCRGIHPEFHLKRPTGGEFAPQFVPADDLRATAAENLKRLGGIHAQRSRLSTSRT